MIFRRGYAAVDGIARTTSELRNEVSRFVRTCVRLITAVGNNLTLFGEANTSLNVIKVGLAAIDRLLGMFRAAPGVGKIIQKILDRGVGAVRRAIPPFQTALARLSRAASLLNITVIPVAKDLVSTTINPFFRPLKRILDPLLETLAALERQQWLLELLLPQAVLRQIERRVRTMEELQARAATVLGDLKAVNDALEDKRAFLTRIYAALSAKKVVLDVVKGYIEEIGAAIQSALNALTGYIPGFIKDLIEELLDWIDDAIDWVIAQVQELLDWVGIDLSGIINWIKSAEDALIQQLSDLMAFLKELEDLVQPIEDLVAWLERETARLTREAEQMLRAVQEEAERLLALLQGITSWKDVVEVLMPFLLDYLREVYRQLEREVPGALEEFRRKFRELLPASWGTALIPAAQLPFIGACIKLVEDTDALLADKATMKSAPARREAVAALELRRAALQAEWNATFGKVMKTLPKTYFRDIERLRAPLATDVLVAFAAEDARVEDAASPALGDEPFVPAAPGLLKWLAQQRRAKPRRRRKRSARSREQLERKIARITSGPTPRRKTS